MSVSFFEILCLGWNEIFNLLSKQLFQQLSVASFPKSLVDPGLNTLIVQLTVGAFTMRMI